MINITLMMGSESIQSGRETVTQHSQYQVWRNGRFVFYSLFSTPRTFHLVRHQEMLLLKQNSDQPTCVLCQTRRILFSYLSVVVDGGKCNCPRQIGLVCSENGETFLNSCLADCEDQPMACDGPCPCTATNSTTSPLGQRATSDAAITPKEGFSGRHIQDNLTSPSRKYD